MNNLSYLRIAFECQSCNSQVLPAILVVKVELLVMPWYRQQLSKLDAEFYPSSQRNKHAQCVPEAPFPYCPLTLPGNDAEQKPHICSVSTVATFYLHTSQQLAMTFVWLAQRIARKASNTLRLTPCLYSRIFILFPQGIFDSGEYDLCKVYLNPLQSLLGE